MNLRVVTAAGAAWRFAPDDPPPPDTARSQSLLVAQLIDEVTAAAPTVPLRVRTGVAGAQARSPGGGRVGVVGRPLQLFYTPSVALAQIDLAVETQGFLPLALNPQVGPQPGYPGSFAARDLGQIALHRAPTRIAGRVFSRSTGALANATVELLAVWLVQQHPMGAPVAPNALYLYPGLYADRTLAATVNRRNFSLAAQIKRLSGPVAAGSTLVRLSDRQAITAGQVLAIEPGDPGRTEYVGIAAIDTTASPDQPADVTLDLPLRRDHPLGAEATRFVFGAAGAANTLARAARAGDFTVWCAALAGIGPTSAAIEINGGGAPTEYQPIGQYVIQSLTQGSYGLPPIHRVAAVRLRASHITKPVPVVREVTLEWGAVEQIVDFVFP